MGIFRNRIEAQLSGGMSNLSWMGTRGAVENHLAACGKFRLKLFGFDFILRLFSKEDGSGFYAKGRFIMTEKQMVEYYKNIDTGDVMGVSLLVP